MKIHKTVFEINSNVAMYVAAYVALSATSLENFTVKKLTSPMC